MVSGSYRAATVRELPPQTTNMPFLKLTGEIDVGRTSTSAPDLPVRLGCINIWREELVGTRR
jgi:hypothetical protein